jgi:hypothetical protein
MRTFVLSLTLVLTSMIAASPARAQSSHTASQTAIDAALQGHVDRAEADREVVRRLLERREVRELAGGLGLDLRRAADAVATLDGQELATLAEQARQVEDSLAGGQSTVTISTTLIIIGLLVLILIIVAVN